MNKTLSPLACANSGFYGDTLVGIWYSTCGLSWFPYQLREAVDKGEVEFHTFWEQFICPVCRDCLQYDEAE